MSLKTIAAQNGSEHESPERPRVAWQKPGETRILGHEIRRVDGPAKVTGRAKYTYDVNLPGLLHARVLRSPYAAALVSTSFAEAMRAAAYGLRSTRACSMPGRFKS